MIKIDVENVINRKTIKPLYLKGVLTQRHKNEINNICDVYNSVTIKNRIKNIHDFIKYDVDGTIPWVKRLEIIQKELNNDIASKYALEIRYGKCNVDKKRFELGVKFSHTLEKYIEKYGKIIGNEKYDEYLRKSKTPWGLKGCVDRYGEIEGKKKWVERLNKKINTQNERKKIKPYRNGRTLNEYQNKYGVKLGYFKWKKRNEKQSYRFSKKYYINTYGSEKGNIKWVEYKKSMDKTSLKSFINRYGEKDGINKYESYLSKINDSGVFYSKSSQKLFWLIYNQLSDDKKKLCRFAKLNGEEYFIVNKFGFNNILVDFKCENKIIEFDGDYWHLNKKQIEIDKLRDEFLTSKGYQILRVRDSEFEVNKEKVIKECIKFIKNE